jgi:hypothetical protein
MTTNNIENEIDNIIAATTQDIDTPPHTTMTNINTNINTNSIQSNDDNTDTNSGTTINNANVEVFNTALHQYLRLDEEIKTLMQAIKTRNEMKKNLGETLSSFLRTNQIKKVDLDGSYKGKRIETVVSTSATGFSRATVTEAIYNELKEDQEVFDKIMQALSRTSVMKEVWRLKIVEEKQTRKPTGTNTRKKKPNVLDEASALIDN